MQKYPAGYVKLQNILFLRNVIHLISSRCRLWTLYALNYIAIILVLQSCREITCRGMRTKQADCPCSGPSPSILWSLMATRHIHTASYTFVHLHTHCYVLLVRYLFMSHLTMLWQLRLCSMTVNSELERIWKQRGGPEKQHDVSHRNRLEMPYLQIKIMVDSYRTEMTVLCDS
jgi:hypothetical protein